MGLSFFLVTGLSRGENILSELMMLVGMVFLIHALSISKRTRDEN